LIVSSPWLMCHFGKEHEKTGGIEDIIIVLLTGCAAVRRCRPGTDRVLA
jgi:hypothetical protein